MSCATFMLGSVVAARAPGSVNRGSDGSPLF